ncbi:MAG: hypothetical protein WCY73_05360 [Bacteroidales bacterium]|jgi:hypothetical protein|nr:hypothetical protein [Bacteroidales bacterium]
MTFEIREISTRKEVKQFSRFPLKLYKNHPQYVPTLVMDEVRSILDSPSMKYCRRRIWIACDQKGKILGRIVGIINPRANEIYGYKRVRFGWFDVVDHFEIARALIQKVADWGASEGMSQIHGPLGYNTWNKQGMLVEGFENLPQFNCLYNYAYYPEFLERMGFSKEVDWIQYIMPAQQPVPDKVERINEMIMKRYGLKLLKWKRPRDFQPYIRDFFDMYNQSFMSVQNFIPLTPDEIRESTRFYMKLINPELSYFVMDSNNRVAAFSISFPSISRALQKAKGYLFPLGWIYLLKAYFFYKDIDLMMNGAHPDWKGKGISSIYYYHTNKTSIRKKLRWAVTNPQLETNHAIDLWKEYDTKLHARRRCYMMDINEKSK